MSYYIGYSLIDNFIYFMWVKYDNKLININDKTYSIKKQGELSIIHTSEFIFISTLNSKNFYGKVIGVYPDNKYSYGTFITTPVSKKLYQILKSFPSGYGFLTRNLQTYTPIIYQSIKNPSYQDKFKVMSFNVCSDFIWTGIQGLKDVSKIISLYDPDIILFQEIGEKNFKKLSQLNQEYHSNYNAGLFSKFKISKVYKRSHFSPIFGAKIILTNGIEIKVFDSHLDDTGYDDIELSKEFQLPNLNYGLYNDIYVNDPSLAAILAGDHNNKSHLDSNEPFPVSIKLQKDGWFDSYREINKKIDISKDSTWPNCNSNPYILLHETGKYCEVRNKNQNENNARIDFLYYKNGENVSLKPIKSLVISKLNNKPFPSDHNALLTEFIISYKKL
jgi:hypothetical protein